MQRAVHRLPGSQRHGHRGHQRDLQKLLLQGHEHGNERTPLARIHPVRINIVQGFDGGGELLAQGVLREQGIERGILRVQAGERIAELA